MTLLQTAKPERSVQTVDHQIQNRTHQSASSTTGAIRTRRQRRARPGMIISGFERRAGSVAPPNALFKRGAA